MFHLSRLLCLPLTKYKHSKHCWQWVCLVGWLNILIVFTNYVLRAFYMELLLLFPITVEVMNMINILLWLEADAHIIVTLSGTEDVWIVDIIFIKKKMITIVILMVYSFILWHFLSVSITNCSANITALSFLVKLIKDSSYFALVF